MVLMVRFFFRLIKRLWTRFGNNIRHIWHEKCRRLESPFLLSCRNVLRTHPHPPAHFLSKRSSSSIYLSPRLCLSMHTTFATTTHCILCIHYQSPTAFHFLLSFLVYRRPPPSINITPVHPGGQTYCLLI